MKAETIMGVVAIVAIVTSIVFAFRQGMKVRNKPEGVPPERHFPSSSP
jgi:hypothetical protein